MNQKNQMFIINSTRGISRLRFVYNFKEMINCDDFNDKIGIIY